RDNHSRMLRCDHPSCKRKKRTYQEQRDLDQHKAMTTKHSNSTSSLLALHLPEACEFCSARCKSKQTLSRHMEKVHSVTFKQTTEAARKSSEDLLSYYYNEVIPSSHDRKESKQKANAILRELLSKVTQTNEGVIYRGSLEKAGSASTKTKVGVANEFDFDLHLNIGSFSLDDSPYLRYRFTPAFGDDTKSLNVTKGVKIIQEPLPPGFIQIESISAPDRLKVGEHLSPRRIHEDLHKRLKEHISNIEGTNHQTFRRLRSSLDTYVEEVTVESWKSR
uniref:C2H2-type domain-containing protein n=1 Tax=Clytia hemisphaerica TaxID=252671 RepID=A0A7M6DQ25_9CNID